MITEHTDHACDSGHRFACPHCGMTPLVDEAVREDMLETGCYLCDRAVDEGDFLLVD